MHRLSGICVRIVSVRTLPGAVATSRDRHCKSNVHEQSARPLSDNSMIPRDGGVINTSDSLPPSFPRARLT